MIKKTIYKLTTTTCGKCRMMQPVWNAVLNMYKDSDNYSFEEIVLDRHEKGNSFITKFNVSSVPTFVITDDNGEMINSFTGTMTIPNFKKFIEG